MSYCLNPACPQPQNPPATKFCLACGSKLTLKDRYRAIKPIGQGGFGRTFLAVDEDKPAKPPCVIKQFFPQAQGTSTVQKAADLFYQEAMRLEELGKHPQIPDLLAQFTQDEQQYLVQEFIDGSNLAQELAANGTFSETQIRELLNDLLPVLQFVHARQTIHRDIKPENIIRQRTTGKLVLVDFGASKVVTGTAMMKTGTSIGSPEYVAPEQVRGKATFASDIYSLGVTCLNLLTQISPFELYDINEDVWIWSQFLNTPVSDALRRVLDKMIHSAPNQRYQSVDEVWQELNPQSKSVGKNQAIKPVVVPLSPPPQINTNQVSPPVVSRSQVDLELAELKAQFTHSTPASPVQSVSHPSPSPKLNQSQVDLELAELRGQFSQSTPGNPVPPAKTPPAISKPIESQVDLELAELKSQFLGSTKSKD